LTRAVSVRMSVTVASGHGPIAGTAVRWVHRESVTLVALL
jgi:hypothetical protein